MEKYIILTASSGEQFYLAADPIYVSLTGEATDRISLTYADRQLFITPTASLVQSDVDAINAAVAECWTKPYTEPTISATLSQDISTVSP